MSAFDLLSPEILSSIDRFAGPDLPLDMVRAMAVVESGGNPFAWRTEPKYRYLWNNAANTPFRPLTTAEILSEIAPTDFSVPQELNSSRNTEWWGQQASWGPLQIMGAVAREYGFRGHFPQLCTAEGVKYACLHLKRLRKRFLAVFGWDGVISAYNQGYPTMVGAKFKNQKYVDKVLKLWRG
jgi:hypothetical protein